MRGFGSLWVALALFIADVMPARAQIIGQGGDDSISIWRVAGALLICLLLAVGGIFALRQRLGSSVLPLSSRRGRRLKLVETLRLSPQSMMCIVDCDGRELLVMASPGGAALLCRLPLNEAKHGRPADEPS